MAADKVDQAIKATDAPGETATVAITLHTGRSVVIAAPDDISPEEVVGLFGYMATKWVMTLGEHRQRRTGPSLLVPPPPRILRT